MTHDSNIIHHFDAATAKRGLLYHGLPMITYPWRAWESRELVWNFFKRELLGRFRGSLGGLLWVLVQPIFQFAVYFLVFGIMFGPKDAQGGGPDPFFAIYLFSGIVLFNSLIEGSSRSLASILGNANLVRKVVFPCELLPLTPVLVASTVYVVGSVVLVVVGLAVGEVQLGWYTLCWPLLILCLVGFAVGLGLFLATAQVFARDVNHLWGVLSMAWLFLSPNFWRVPLIREAADGYGAGWIVDWLVLNPAYCMLLAQRQIFGIGSSLSPEEYAECFPLTLGENLMVSAAWAAVSLYIGFGFFMSRKHKFADLI